VDATRRKSLDAGLLFQNGVSHEVTLSRPRESRNSAAGIVDAFLARIEHTAFSRKRRPASMQKRSPSAISRSQFSMPRSSMRLWVRAITDASQKDLSPCPPAARDELLSTIFSRWRIPHVSRRAKLGDVLLEVFLVLLEPLMEIDVERGCLAESKPYS